MMDYIQQHPKMVFGVIFGAGIVLLLMHELISDYIIGEPTPTKVNPAVHKEHYPHEHCPYTRQEIFFDEIRRVLDFYPWIDNAMIQWPNRPANRDAFISSLCRAYQEKFMDILAKQNKKHEDLFKMTSMLKGMHLECGQCEPCKKREATIGKETDLTIPPCEFAGKFDEALHEFINGYNFYSLHKKN